VNVSFLSTGASTGAGQKTKLCTPRYPASPTNYPCSNGVGSWARHLLVLPWLCLASDIVLAQGSAASATLYGILDQSLSFTNDQAGKHVTRSGTGTFSGSRWGLKINEPLGNGLSAFGVMEAGFDGNTGRSMQGGALFGRQAFVGLGSDEHGAMTFGRQYDASIDTLSPLTAGGSWATGVNGRLYGNDNAGLSYRIDNTLKFTATRGGLKTVGTYSFSNTNGSRDNSAFSAGAHYANGPLSLAGAYVQLNNPNSGNSRGAAVDKGSFTAEKQQTWGVGFTYLLGDIGFGTSYSHTRVQAPTHFPGGGLLPPVSAHQLRLDNIELHLKYRTTVALTTGVVYIHTRARAQDHGGTIKRPHWHQIGGVADYALSKRTDIYLAAAYQRAAGERTGHASFDRANLNCAGGLSGGSGQWTTHIGLRHKF